MINSLYMQTDTDNNQTSAVFFYGDRLMDREGKGTPSDVLLAVSQSVWQTWAGCDSCPVEIKRFLFFEWESFYMLAFFE